MNEIPGGRPRAAVFRTAVPEGRDEDPAPGPPHPVRRRTLAALALAGAAGVAGIAGCTVPAPRRGGPTADPAPGLPITSSRRAQLMQIVAHPDDDLYFMNPDCQRMVDAGVPLVCVYVTAGEHTGENRVPGRTGGTPADKEDYSSARHQGLRQAYARMIGLDEFTPWQRGVVTLRGDRQAEIDTLAHGDRRVQLVFLNLAMHAPRHWTALPDLWEGRAPRLRTVVATGSPVRSASEYDHDGLVDVLVGLMEHYRPTVVHTLDPDPDIQHSDEATRKKDSEQPGYSDHADHTAVASFSWAAMVRWVAEATADGGSVPAFVTTSFRGYYNRHWPKNLPEPVLREKAAHLVPYGGDPSWQCGNAAGCGDYMVGGTRPLTNRKGWVRATHHRHPGPGPVVATGPDGRLSVYGVLGLRAVRWRETGPDSGRWAAPDDLGGGPLAPGLGSATLPDGRQLLFGLRFAALGGPGGAGEREIVVLEQRSAGGPFLAWRGLGNPEPDDDRGRRIGVPVAVTDREGRVHLFVRDADKGVSTRVRDAGGAWGPWRSLGGEEVQDGLSAAVDGRGRVHLFATGRDRVHHWAQEAPGGPVAFRVGGPALPVPGGPVGVATAPGGEPALYYRRPAERGLTAVRPDGTPLPAPAFDGYGRVDAVGTPKGPVLLGRDLRGRVQLYAGGDRAVRAEGVAALGPATAHLVPRGVMAVGLGADAHPWTWVPQPRTES
ncbi:PIG-L family deacetylase [Streptomyces sudanensis]|uniref:PIG-L family deacetylase n=1 Tax=Streptomyces sudanensis TaxID=436397 RepID=UPI0020CCA559|nr:PIG-L family deacetylase [Streptomyces sudanensis]MCQ0001714.1 PIG-L family deacetylase [Streptomyces sudanensis]